MTPAGERMLWAVLLVLAALGLFILWIKFRQWRNNPLRIRKKIWYSGGLKMKVTVRNVHATIVDIDTPVIHFCQPRMKKRKFRIIVGNEPIFPLGLSPQTSYEFMVEFTRLFDKEPILRKYQQVVIEIKSPAGKTITQKKVRISLPE